MLASQIKLSNFLSNGWGGKGRVNDTSHELIGSFKFCDGT